MRIRLSHWLLVVLVSSSCSFGGGTPDSFLTFQETRTFNAQTLFRSWNKVIADLRYVGSHCLVYVDSTEPTLIPDAVIAEIGQAFDSRAYPIVTSYFGEPYDVDGNGKVILLLLDIQDGYTEGSDGYVAGYFDYSHMYAASTVEQSNQADMIFLDTYPGLRTAMGAIDPVAKEDLKLTLAHEFQHLVNFSEKVIRQKASHMDTWINEGLSSAAEYLYLGKHVQWKIDYFNQIQYRGEAYDPLKDANLWGQYFVSWGKWGDPLVNYSTVYLFFQWLRIQGGSSPVGAPEVYRRILQDPSSNYQAVVNAFNTLTGINWTWKEIFQSWLVANFLNQPSGVYGYKHLLTDEQGRVRYLYPRFFVNLTSDQNKIYQRGSYPPFSVSIGTAGKAFLLPGDAVYVLLPRDLSLMETAPITYGAVNLAGNGPQVKLGIGSYNTGEIIIAGNAKGAFDGYVYSTESLLDPGSSGTVVGISSLAPQEAGWIPKGSMKTPKGTLEKGSSRPPQRPLPMDALLGASGQEKGELLQGR